MNTADQTSQRADVERYQPDLVRLLRVYDTGDPDIPRDYATLPKSRWWQRCDRCIAFLSTLIFALTLALAYLVEQV